MSAGALVKSIGRGIFMAEVYERMNGERDETRDWRKFVIPAMGSIILVLLGVIVSLVTLDRSGIKADIVELRAEIKATNAKQNATVDLLKEKDQLHDQSIAELKTLIRLNYPERSKLFWGNGDTNGSPRPRHGGK
jgi:hypothetical protein